MRLFWIFLGLALLFLVPFAFWGEALGERFSSQGAVAWLKGYGQWAWAAGLLLLVSDLFLPIPGTAVIAALGFVYGPVVGGLLGAAGSFFSGALAYGLCRMTRRAIAIRIVGERDLAEGERLFARFGGWLVALSRWLPLLPEVIACMAGLTRMPARVFFPALACGALPLGFTYAAVGHAGVEHPGLALALSAVAPPVLWLVIQAWLRRNDQ